ncbi:MAG: flavodoxin [Clostridiales bacterium]|nr:flavodoxin [Clostridiales bacterium]
MKTGIIIHSSTGNTLSVAERVAAACRAHGSDVRVERVTAMDESPQARSVTLRDIPDVSDCDVVLLGAPVWGFSLSTVMAQYLSQIPSLSGKKVGCFVTQKLPRPWLGGNRAIAQMKRLCADKGAQVSATGIVNWSNRERESLIADVTERMSGLAGGR